MQPSPYTPGAVTRDIVGREKQITAIQRDLAYLVSFPRFSGRIQVYVGPRGVGKTSLLRAAQVQAQAEALGLHTVWVTAGDGNFLVEIMEEFGRYADTWKTAAAESFKELLASVKISIGGLQVSAPANKKAQSQAGMGRKLQEVLVRAAEAAKENSKRGLVLFVDEIQSADPDGLRALAYAWQHMQSENPDIPLLGLTAGLSHSQDVITDAVSFAERFRYVHLNNLDPEASEQALVEPALAMGVGWADDALQQALDIARGYPYFLQLMGDLSWQAAGDPDPGKTINAAHVSDAAEDFHVTRDDFFRSRWMKATEREIAVITAMATLALRADDPDEVLLRRKDIATEMGVETSAISMARRSLMDKGLIEAPEFGKLSFTAPGFAEFVDRTAH